VLLQVGLVSSKIPPAVPAPVIAPLLYIILSFVLPLAPVVGGFCPLVLWVLMLAFGAKNVMNVTLHNGQVDSSVAAKATAAAATVKEAVSDAAKKD
jgi:hypothetical protein